MSCAISDNVRRAVPDIDLVYWCVSAWHSELAGPDPAVCCACRDYYHVASDFYSQMIARHRTLLHDPERFAAGGAGGSVEMSADSTRACAPGCRVLLRARRLTRCNTVAERERSYETFDMDGGAMGPAATVTGCVERAVDDTAQGRGALADVATCRLDSLADDDDVGNDDANASDGGDAQGRPSRAQSTRSLGSSVDRQVIVATGAWTWNRFWVREGTWVRLRAC